MDKEVKEFLDQNRYWKHVPKDQVDENIIKDSLSFTYWKFGKELEKAKKEIKQAIYDGRWRLFLMWIFVMAIAFALS